MAAITYATRGSIEQLGRIASKVDTRSIKSEADCQVYKRRWLMLTIYLLCAVAVETHWLHYAITTQTVHEYYGVSDLVVDLTSMTYGITFVIFVFPAIWLIEKYGLKKMLICGDGLIIAAAGLKLGSLKPEHFYVGFFGQILAGIAQVFIVNVPSYLAGLWFPKNEVSTACALGVMGTQVGNALSFFIPPHLIALGEQNTTNGAKDTKMGLLYVYIYLAILPVALLPLLIFLFESRPPKPPSFARIANQDHHVRGWSTVKELAKNTNYILVVVSYSMNVSVFYCMSTMMNQIITSQKFAGTVGAIVVIFGIFGCFFLGWLLDKVHAFKLISLVTYMVSIVGLIIFWLSRMLNWHESMYILSGVILGVCLASYVIIAIEFSSELTYPISETISTSILLASGELLSIIFIYTTALLFDNYGVAWVIITTSTFMVMGLVPTSLTWNVQLKRHEASLHPWLPSVKKRSKESPRDNYKENHQYERKPDALSINSTNSNRKSKSKEKEDPEQGKEVNQKLKGAQQYDTKSLAPSIRSTTSRKLKLMEKEDPEGKEVKMKLKEDDQKSVTASIKSNISQKSKTKEKERGLED